MHMAGKGHVRVNRLKPHALIYAYMEHAQFVTVAEKDTAAAAKAAVSRPKAADGRQKAAYRLRLAAAA